MSDGPRTIEDYLAELRAAFGDADRALVGDALADAEEYLRGELAQHPGEDPVSVLAGIVRSYGAPAEVAAAYRQTEATVQRALEPRRGAPPAADGTRRNGGLFGVFSDPYAYGAVFYMLLSLVTGLGYFTWTITGVAMSAGFLVLIIGIPFLLLFLASVRVLALVEGRVVEVLLGVRMPRRPAYSAPLPLLERIKEMLVDARTWSALLYMMLMLPLGLFYFTLAVVGLVLPLALVAAPLANLALDGVMVFSGDPWLEGALDLDGPAMLLLPLLGATLFVLFMHLARSIGRLHGALAKALLVRL